MLHARGHSMSFGVQSNFFACFYSVFAFSSVAVIELESVCSCWKCQGGSPVDWHSQWLEIEPVVGLISKQPEH